MSVTAAEVEQVLREADRLYTTEQVFRAFDRLAEEITTRLSQSEPVLMCVMNGGLVPTGQLVPRLNFPAHVDYLHATRYRGATEGGRLSWIAPPQLDIRGRCVLVIDDILDEGITLSSIIEALESQGAAEVQSAVLVEKRHDRKHGLAHADYAGLEVEDRYVFGFGMDYHGFLRNAPGIYAVNE